MTTTSREDARERAIRRELTPTGNAVCRYCAARLIPNPGDRPEVAPYVHEDAESGCERPLPFTIR